MKKIIPLILGVLIVSAVIVSGAFIIFNNLSQPIDISEITDLSEEPLIEEIAQIPVPDFIKPEPEISLLVVGDIMLSRGVEQLMVKKNNFQLPFGILADLTKDNDITLGNLETAIISGRPIMTGEFAFRTDPKSVKGLIYAGFDVLSLANNHTPNFGRKGLKSTFKELESAGIDYVGAGLNKELAQKPVIIEKEGIKVGFLAYSYSDFLPQSYQATEKEAGIVFMDEEIMKEDIEKLKPQVDWLIILMHAGTEYASELNKQQIEFAHAAIDLGADLIIGHHPHVVQTFEKYKDGYIIYSLGNFIFDQLWSEETRQGIMVKIIFTPNEIKSIEFIPVIINENFQPELVEGGEAEKIISRLNFELFRQPKFYWTGKDYSETVNWQVSQGQLAIQPSTYQTVDLDQDDKLEEVVIVKGIAYLLDNDKVVWASNPEWKIDNVVIGDFTNDGEIEIGFSLWKKGNYGPDLPFWLQKNDTEVANHLFLYRWDKDSLKLFWGSSNLDQPIRELTLADLDKDGSNELIVLEGDYSQGEKELANNLSIWRWWEWGFFNQYKSRQGNFFDLTSNLNYIYIREVK